MTEIGPALFRQRALKQQVRKAASPALPWLASPRSFFLLWLLVAAMCAAVALSWFIRVPVHADGVAVVVRAPGTTPMSEPPELQLIVLVPAEAHRHVAPGLRLAVEGPWPGAPISAEIRAVEPDILSPDAVRRRFEVEAGTSAAPPGPSAVLLAPFDPGSGALRPADYLGSRLKVRVQTGTRPALSFVPLLGRLLPS